MYLRTPSILTALNLTNVLQELNQSAGYPSNIGIPERNHTAATVPFFGQVIANGSDVTNRFEIMSSKFPPKTWLGFGLDLTSVTPLDITSVACNVLSGFRVVSLQEDKATEQDFHGLKWEVPPNVDISVEVGQTYIDTQTFKNGQQAAEALSVGGRLNAQYTAIQGTSSGDLSVDFAIRKSFSGVFQYSMFTHNQPLLLAQFDEYLKYVEEKYLRARVDRLDQFDPTNTMVIEQYRTFFGAIGTHIITKVLYGARLQLNAWADNSHASVNKKFQSDVGAEFKGLTAGGKVDAKVSAESQYGTFEESIQNSITCRGGDPYVASQITADPKNDTVYDEYLAWVKTAQTRPNIMSFSTEPLWAIMAGAVDPVLARRGPDVQRAYNWLVENPEQHLTPVRLIITSDWGEIGLETPSAYFMKDPNSQAPIPDGVRLTPTKVNFPGGVGQQRGLTIEFLILNDGGAVDISLSHGSGGKIEAVFGGQSYVASGITDNKWNTKQFHACAVNRHGRSVPADRAHWVSTS